MAYLGRGIENLSDRVVLDSLTASATASYTLQLNSVNFVPSSASSLTVSLNGVIQKPESSYTVSGSTLTFASALTSSDSIDFIIAERGITLQTPSAGSVGTSQLASTAVTTAKIADDAVTFDKMTGQNYPAFSASMSADQTLTDAAQTKVQFDTENFDTDNAYDHSTNYRFTVPSGKAGKYLIYSTVTGYSNPSRLQYVQTFLFKNGSSVGYSTTDPRNAGFGFFFSCYITKVLDLSVGDYIEIYTTVDPEASGTYDAKLSTTSGGATFGGYRIGD